MVAHSRRYGLGAVGGGTNDVVVVALVVGSSSWRIIIMMKSEIASVTDPNDFWGGLMTVL
jgi:hypothetical protein